MKLIFEILELPTSAGRSRYPDPTAVNLPVIVYECKVRQLAFVWFPPSPSDYLRYRYKKL